VDTIKLRFVVAEYQLLIYLNCTIYKLAAVLDSGTVTDAPLEVGLGVSLDECVDGSNTSLGVGRGMVGGRGPIWRGVPRSPHKAVLRLEGQPGSQGHAQAHKADYLGGGGKVVTEEVGPRLRGC